MGEKEQGNPEDAAARSGGYIKMGSVEGELSQGGGGGGEMRAAPEKKDQQR